MSDKRRGVNPVAREGYQFLPCHSCVRDVVRCPRQPFPIHHISVGPSVVCPSVYGF